MRHIYSISFGLLIFFTFNFCKEVADKPLSVAEIYHELSSIDSFPFYMGYIAIENLRPGQSRYAQGKVDKIIKHVKKYGEKPRFFNNTSILSKDRAIPVIVGPKDVGLVVVDGLHSILASLQFGAKTVPIKIIADLSNLSENSFWQEAARRNFVYLYNIFGDPIYRISKGWNWGKFGNLKDDPNLYFASISARKCLSPTQQIDQTIGADHPLWVKIGGDIPFVELKIADALSNDKVNYNYALGNDFTNKQLQAFVEKARLILSKKPIKGIKLVPTRTFYRLINDGNICQYRL